MEKKYRRLQNNLVIAGGGLLAFTVWSVVRALLILVTYRKELLSLVEEEMEEDSSVSPGLAVTMAVILVLIVAIPLIYVGKAARDEGRGRKSRKAYIGIALLLAIPQAVTVVQDLVGVFNAAEEISEMLITAAIDVTTLCVLLETAVTAIRVKKHQKILASAGE